MIKAQLPQLLLLLLFAAAANAQDDKDYRCFPGRDQSVTSACPTLNDKVCDDPNWGGSGGDRCKNQDCIDCNIHCKQFTADCYGCLNTNGCYYCPEDGTCENSDQYISSNRQKQCTNSWEYLSVLKGHTPEKCIAPDAKTLDPLYEGSKWMYEMTNIVDVWDEYELTGEGVRIRINDDGVYIDNKEFDGRFLGADVSCPDYLPIGEDVHGTQVAGIILGNANNDLCAAGIAPQAKFSSCNFFAESVPVSRLAWELDSFDISQNSVGMPACMEGGIERTQDIIHKTGCPFTYDESKYKPCEVCDGEFVVDRALSADCEEAIFDHCKKFYKEDEDACKDFPELIIGGDCDYTKLPSSALDAIESGIKYGRDGKGVIFTFASGNSFTELDDVNFSGWTNTRYTITVGAVGKDGLHADYSSGGAALSVVAPSGADHDVGHLMTAGIGREQCADSGQGTSFACPVVSGIIALMLEANPELTWRDVQGILAQTSKIVQDAEDESAVDNGGGFWHSNWYGFGLIDAKAAVDAAYGWDLYNAELQAIGMSVNENKVLTDQPNNEFSSTIRMNPSADDYPTDFVAESTVVMLDLSHYNRGDLELELISPSGTSSILHPGKIPENSQLSGDERWKLMSLRNWGENIDGNWVLKVRDLVDREETLDQNIFRTWKLVVYGRSPSGLTGFGEADNSNKSEYCMDPNDPEVLLCYLGPSGDTVCPASSQISAGSTQLTLDAKLSCPTDTLGAQGIGYAEASRNGLCGCEAGLYDGNCDVIEEDLECQCYACPQGSPLGYAYGCNKEIIQGCKTFDCNGNCNVDFEFPMSNTYLPTSEPTKKPTGRPSERPTFRPTNNPTKRPTNSPTKPDATNEPTRRPTNNPTLFPTRRPTARPSNNPTKRPTLGPTTRPTQFPTNRPTNRDAPRNNNSGTERPTNRPTNFPTVVDAIAREEKSEDAPTDAPEPSAAPTQGEVDPGFALMDGNLACETGMPIDARTTPVEGTIRSFSLFGLEGDCLSGLETIGGWYQAIGTGNVFTLTACSLDPSKSVGISVFTGPCSQSECIEHQSRQIAACEDGNGHSTSFATEQGTVYNILVSGLPVGAPLPVSDPTALESSPKERRRLDEDELTSDFVLDLTESEEAPNSKCGTALPTSYENAIVGSTKGDLTTYETCYDKPKSGVWYTVTGGEPDYEGVIVYEANTCNPDSNFYNAISVFRGDECGSKETCVDVDILPCPNGWFGQQVYWSTSIQENYKVFVHSAENPEALVYNAGDFRMNLNYNDRLENDQCNAAKEIALNREGAVKSVTAGAKPDINAIEKSSCGTGGAGAWYTVVGTGSVFQATTCSGNTNHRTNVQVFSGECGKLKCIVSGGGNRALCDNGKGSVVNFKTQEGTVYYILVTPRREGETGIFGLEVNELPELEMNNDCWAAETIGPDTPTVSGSTKAATYDFTPGNTCVVPLDAPGVWYEIDGGAGKGIELSTCQNNNFDTAISVFSGTCEQPRCVAGSSADDPDCTEGNGVKTSFYAEPNTKYRVYVHGRSESANSMGDFNLNYREFDILEANEFCTGAREVPTDGTRVQGSTEDATHASIPAASCGVPITNPGLWYTFKGNGQPFEIRACSEDEGEFDVSLSIFEGGPGGCDTLTCLTGTTFPDTVCGATSQQRLLQGGGISPVSEFRFMTEGGQDYYIFVHGQDGAQGVGDFALYIRDEMVAGFGTEAPTVTPIKYGKDLHRWVPVNTSMLAINTDYFNLEMIAAPAAGNATVKGYWIAYTPNPGFEGDDIMTLNGCNDGECYRFDVTINVHGDRVDESGSGDGGFNKMWLLLLLLLLLIPLICIPFICFYLKKKREREQDNYDDDDWSRGEDDSFGDEGSGDKGLLPGGRKPNRRDESSVEDDDWESSADERSDDDDSRYSRSDNESQDDFADGFVGQSEREAFNDEYGRGRRR